jgi:hypothetical protein
MPRSGNDWQTSAISSCYDNSFGRPVFEDRHESSDNSYAAGNCSGVLESGGQTLGPASQEIDQVN